MAERVAEVVVAVVTALPPAASAHPLICIRSKEGCLPAAI
jgi:hypothetical protein